MQLTLIDSGWTVSEFPKRLFCLLKDIVSFVGRSLPFVSELTLKMDIVSVLSNGPVGDSIAQRSLLETTTKLPWIFGDYPNIPVGNVPVISWNQGDPHYPFKLISRYSDFVQTTSSQSFWQNTQIGLDLASANAMYGGAETVQTASIRGYMLIRFE